MYGYESSATLTKDRLHYKLQTRPIVREGSPRRRAKLTVSRKDFDFAPQTKENFQTATFWEEVISGRKSHKGARYQDTLTD
jgi:hypothetical protein